MNIKEFAQGRGVDPQAVSRYIARHSDEFDGLITRDGKSSVLSDEAIEILDDVYPLPRPVEVVVDHVSREKLVQAQDQIIRLQKQLMDQTALIADSKYNKLLLEQRNDEIARKEKEISQLDDTLQQKDDEIRRLQEQLAKVSSDLSAEQKQRERMEQSGLITRIFKTWK